MELENEIVTYLTVDLSVHRQLDKMLNIVLRTAPNPRFKSLTQTIKNHSRYKILLQETFPIY